MYKINVLKPGFLVLFLSVFTMIGCSNEDEPSETVVTVNQTALVSNGDDFIGDIDGDFTGSGGSVSRTFNWINSLSTAEYNADFTASATGIFRMVVKDITGKTVLDRSLTGATEPDSFSGVTSTGSPGEWSVTITLTSFNGDGSFSLSEGD